MPKQAASSLPYLSEKQVYLELSPTHFINVPQSIESWKIHNIDHDAHEEEGKTGYHRIWQKAEEK